MARRAEGRTRDHRRSDQGRAALGGLVIAFLLGVLLTAGAAVALTLADGGDRGGEQSPEASPTPGASDGAPGGSASGDVPESCVQAAEYNETLTQAIDEIALGARDQDAARLAEALDAIQDAQPGSEAASQECRALAGEGSAESPEEGSDDSSESEATESPEPTEGAATPTPTP